MAEKRKANKRPSVKRAPVSTRAKLSDEAMHTLFDPIPMPKDLLKERDEPKPRAAPRPRVLKPKPAPKPEPEVKSNGHDHNASSDWAKTMASLAERSQAMMQQFLERQHPATAGILPSNMFASFFDLTSHMMSDPVKLMNAQLSLWDQYMKLWQSTTTRFLGGAASPIALPLPGDKRFKDPAWQENPVFDYIKQSYLLTAGWMQNQASQVEGLDSPHKKKLEFYARQFVDALSPTNFFLTNPQVLRTTLESKGENLAKGLENLLEDMGKGRLTMTDEKAFKVGENLALSPGAVVFRNDLIELIQYSPSTPQVARRPLLIFPPWINKYYILDLKPENSFIKWAVEQGLTVFCVSWVNPDKTLEAKCFEDYMTEGVLAAMDAVEMATGEREINIIGYCLGGTLLAATLAYLNKTDPARAARVKSATYFTTMVDFEEPGELGVFIDDTQLEALETDMREKGYLDAREMSTTFNLLRANDLIWSFVVNNYMLGKQPFPFDLLYWNGDNTRMPAAMHSFYLRNMYQKNLLAKPGGLSLAGVPIDLRTIKTPSYILSTREDHIAPWASTYAATKIYQGPVTFVLAGSGHIAGVVNPPAAKKYQHWTNPALPADPAAWLEGAKAVDGSWWGNWREWLRHYDGGSVAARKVGGGKLRALADAPGEYVRVRAV